MSEDLKDIVIHLKKDRHYKAADLLEEQAREIADIHAKYAEWKEDWKSVSEADAKKLAAAQEENANLNTSILSYKAFIAENNLHDLLMRIQDDRIKYEKKTVKLGNALLESQAENVKLRKALEPCKVWVDINIHRQHRRPKIEEALAQPQDTTALDEYVKNKLIDILLANGFSTGHGDILDDVVQEFGEELRSWRTGKDEAIRKAKIEVLREVYDEQSNEPIQGKVKQMIAELEKNHE